MTLSIEQQNHPCPKAPKGNALAYQSPTYLPLTISAVENELPTQGCNWITLSRYAVQSIYRLGLTSL
jgi:hypothetical protein